MPPPRIWALLSAPGRVRLVSMVSGPSYVPAPITIVAPLAAALIATWMLVWSQPAGQTVIGSAAAAGSAPASGSAASVAAASATGLRALWPGPPVVIARPPSQGW